MSPNIELRKTQESDIEFFFEHQADDDAAYMAAFTSKDPKDREAYVTKWKHLINEPTVHMQTILYEKEVAGTVTKFEKNGEASITYALAKKLWGKGIVSKAVQEFVTLEKTRPLFGRAAADNARSIKILEKGGFKMVGHETNFANARGKEIPEVVYRLD